jgi:integrase
VLGLAVRHIDLLHGTVKIERQLQEVAPKNTQRFGEPKSEASRRTLPLPSPVADALWTHIEKMEDPGPDTLLFTGYRGGPLRRHVWHGEWKAAREKLGHPKLAFHDLRHSALTIYAGAGATLAELQAHAGHSTVDAALRYQHATHDRAVVLAAIVDDLIMGDSSGPPPAGL